MRIDGVVPEIVQDRHIELFQQRLRIDKSEEKQFEFAIGEVCGENSDVEFSELALFDKRLTQTEALPFQTYLALKYGITLHSVNYTLATGEVIWSARDDKSYYNRVVGVGCDTLFGFAGFESVQCCGDPTIKLVVDTLQHGQFIITGDDDKPLDFSWRDTLNNVVDRSWEIKPYGINFPVVTIAVDPMWFSFEQHSCRLIKYDGTTNNIDIQRNYQVFVPDSVDSFGMVYFSDVKIDEDGSGSDIITFSGYPKQQITEKLWENDSETDFTELYGIDVKLYPNPSSGDYAIDIVCDEVQSVEVRMYNSGGQLVSSQFLVDDTEYHVSGHVDVPQLYHIELVFDSVTIMKKLLVQ